MLSQDMIMGSEACTTKQSSQRNLLNQTPSWAMNEQTVHSESTVDNAIQDECFLLLRFGVIAKHESIPRVDFCSSGSRPQSAVVTEV